MSTAKIVRRSLIPIKAYREPWSPGSDVVVFVWDGKPIIKWPNVVNYNNQDYVRTGYDSDEYRVYYKSKIPFATY